MPKTAALTWKRGRRNRTGNLYWESRCGRYRVVESARYLDIHFDTILYSAWHNGGTGFSKIALPRLNRGKVVGTQDRFRTRKAAEKACQRHATRRL